MNTQELRDTVISRIREHGPQSRPELASVLGTTKTAIGYHLTQMWKKGMIQSKKHKWHIVPKKKQSDEPEQMEMTLPKKEAEPEPSLKVLLLTAEAAIKAALDALEEVESRIAGS